MSGVPVTESGDMSFQRLFGQVTWHVHLSEVAAFEPLQRAGCSCGWTVVPGKTGDGGKQRDDYSDDQSVLPLTRQNPLSPE